MDTSRLVTRYVLHEITSTDESVRNVISEINLERYGLVVRDGVSVLERAAHDCYKRHKYLIDPSDNFSPNRVSCKSKLETSFSDRFVLKCKKIDTYHMRLQSSTLSSVKP